MNKDTIDQIILDNPALSYAELESLTGLSERTLRKRRRKLGIPPTNRWKSNLAASEEKAVSVGQEDILSGVEDIIRKKRPVTITDIADMLDCSPSRVKSAIEKLREQRILAQIVDDVVMLSDKPENRPASTILTNQFFGNTIRFGACGDNHMCSRYERMDVLNALYDIYEREGITTVYNTGNWIDGEARFNKNDIFVHGLGNQLQYFVDNYPSREGITTYFIAGDDHEGWYVQREGVDIGQLAEDLAIRCGRTDLRYIGYMEHDIVLQSQTGDAVLRVQHPGGGSSYAISYTSQKMIESLSGGEKPQIILAGHYHKSEYLYYRNVHLVQTGCTMDQSPFMRKKRLSAHIGGWIIEANQAEDGSINRFKPEWISFYNREFYEQNWRYRMNNKEK